MPAFLTTDELKSIVRCVPMGAVIPAWQFPYEPNTPTVRVPVGWTKYEPPMHPTEKEYYHNRAREFKRVPDGWQRTK